MPRMKKGMKKRGASIQYRFYVDGKRYAVTGKTSDECLEKAAEKERMIREGVSLKNANPTLAEYFEEWEARRKGTVLPTTEIRVRQRLGIVLKRIGKTRVKEVTRRQIISLAGDIAKKYSVTEVRKILASLSQMMWAAANDEIIERSPVYRITFPSLKKKMPARDTNHRALSSEELHDFMETAKDSYYYDAICMQLNTGMRVGEVLGLQWQDVDWKAGVIHIRRTVTRIGNSVYKLGDTTKTRAGARTFPINAPIREILERRQRVTNAFSKKALLFTTSRGELANVTLLNGAIYNALRKANAKREAEGREPIAPFSTHAFRATFISMAAYQGIPLNTVKELVGHKDINLTASLYGHVYEDAKKEAMQNFSIGAEPKDRDKEEAGNG